MLLESVLNNPIIYQRASSMDISGYSDLYHLQFIGERFGREGPRVAEEINRGTGESYK
jgi:hypothetical protein